MAISQHEIARVTITVEGKDDASPVIKRAGQALDEYGKKAKDATQHSDNFFTKVGKGARDLGLGVIGITGLAQGIGGLAQSMVSGNAQMETYRVGFEVLLGSVDAAKTRMQELAQFAAATPFELPEVVQASRTLQVFGGTLLATGENLKRVGDVAAGTNQQYAEVAMWYGRMYDSIQSGRPFGEAAARMQEMGAMSGQTRAKLEEMQKAGASGAEIWKVYTDSLDSFGGMMDKQSHTFEGLMSTLSDSFNQAKNAALEPLFEQLKKLAEWLTSPEVQAGITQMATAFGQFLKEAIEKTIEAVKTLWGIGQDFVTFVNDHWVTAITVLAITAFPALQRAIETLTLTTLPAARVAVMEFIASFGPLGLGLILVGFGVDELRKKYEEMNGQAALAALMAGKTVPEMMASGINEGQPKVKSAIDKLVLTADMQQSLSGLGLNNGMVFGTAVKDGVLTGVPIVGTAAQALVNAANKQAAMYAQGYNNGVSFNQGLADAMRKALPAVTSGSNYVGSESGYAAYASASYGQYGASTAMGAAQSAETVKAAEDAKAKAMAATARAATAAGNKIEAAQKKVEAAQKKAAAAAEEMAKRTADAWNGMQAYLKEVAKKIADNIDKEWTAALKGGIKGVFNNLSLDSELQTVGAKQIITAIARGIEQFDSALIFGAAFDKVIADVKKGIKDSIQKAFDKLFTEIEQSANLTQGIRDIGKQIGEATTISPTEGGKGFEALSKLNDFVAPSKAKIDSFFTSLSEMVHVFGEKAVEWKDTMTEQAARVALYVGVWVDLVGKAIDPIVKLSDPKTIMPSKEAIDAFFSALGAVVAGFAQKSEEWKGKFGIEAVRFTNNIGGVVQILSKALDPLLKLPEVQKITPEQIEGAMANLWLALHHLGEVMKSGELQGDFLKRATEFSAAVLAVLTNIKQAFADWTDKTNVDSITKIWFDGFNAMFQFIVSPWGPQTTDQLNFWLLKMDNLFHSYVDDMVSYWNSQMGSLALPEPASPPGSNPPGNPPGTNPSGYNPFTPRGPKAPITVNNYGPGSLFVDGQFVTQLPADTHASLVQVARRKQQNNPGAIG